MLHFYSIDCIKAGFLVKKKGLSQLRAKPIHPIEIATSVMKRNLYFFFGLQV